MMKKYKRARARLINLGEIIKINKVALIERLWFLKFLKFE